MLNNVNKATLSAANEAIRKGDYEIFLSFCTEDTEWTFVGERILQGKDAVRSWMAQAYSEPPDFTVEELLAGEDHVIAIGKIRLKNAAGVKEVHSYCDVWKFHEGKMAALKAFVIQL